MKKLKLKTRPEKPQEIELSDKMKSLIEEAYKIFPYNLNGQLSVCTCPVCISEEDVKKLMRTPVKEIDRELMYEYLGAVNYDESGYEIRHFLPRILELTANYEYIRLDTSINLDKCHFEKDIWSKEELDFMKRFSSQLIIDVLNTDSDARILENVFIYILMFNLAGLEIEHLLDLNLWLEKGDKSTALQHFENMMYYHTDSYTYFKYSFSGNPDFNNRINMWIKSREVARAFLPIIEDYYFNASSDTDSEKQWRMDHLYSILEKNLKDSGN